MVIMNHQRNIYEKIEKTEKEKDMNSSILKNQIIIKPCELFSHS
jgi:hypothetical protein